MENSDPTLVDYLVRIQKLTANGEMTWSKANPTTYLWTTKNPVPGRMVLQRTTGKFGTGYVLQVLDPARAEPRLVIEGARASASGLNTHLAAIFNTIQSLSASESLQFLGSILPSESPSSSEK